MASGRPVKTRLLSVTLDPALDTPQVLKEYGASLQADPRFGPWRGDENQTDSITRAFSVIARRKAEPSPTASPPP